MDFDSEIEEIRRRKLQEMMNSARETEAKPVQAAGVTVLTDATFRPFIQGNGVSLVDFWAPWCGPCRMVSPIVEELAREYSGRAAFGKLNVDENPNTSAQFNIMGIPTLLIFRRGRNVDSIVGAQSKGAIAARLNRAIGLPG
jgi:thioredoxin 1